MRTPHNCHDCGVAPGEPHLEGCDTSRCLVTGGQYIQCGGELHEFNGRTYGEHEGSCGKDIWTGLWPGVLECREYGWYSYFVNGHGWVRCEPDHPDASEDLNRLVTEARWDSKLVRWVK